MPLLLFYIVRSPERGGFMENPGSAFGAEAYDGDIRRTLPYYEEFYKQIIDVVRLCAPRAPHWLDVGCGTGEMARVACAALPVGRFVFCDTSPEMLAAARRRFVGAQYAFWQTPAQALDARGAFDVVTAVFAHHYLQPDERRAAVQNCFHALRPGGLFFAFENVAPESEAGKAIGLARWKAYQLAQGRDAEAVEAHLARYGRGYFPITVARQLELLRECGFETAELLWASYLQAGVLGIKS